MSTGM